jgi:hypothetical protein
MAHKEKEVKIMATFFNQATLSYGGNTVSTNGGAGIGIITDTQKKYADAENTASAFCI